MNCKIDIGIVVALCDKNQGISYNGNIPWPYNRLDHAFYLNLITSTSDPEKKNGVMIGRLCWETMAEEDKPKNSIVVTSTSIKDTPVHCRAVTCNYEAAMKELQEGVVAGELERIWILGGRQNYQHAINDLRVSQIVVTRIFKEFPVDAFFPEFQHKFHRVSCSDIQTDNDVDLQFETWERNTPD